MNVGISSSFISDGSGGGCTGADRLAGCSTGLTYPVPTPTPGGAGRIARSRKGRTPGAPRAGISAPAGLSNPVAITVTRISPCIAGSFTVPKMISASSPAASLTTSEIWVTSPRVRSSPPVMLISTPVAPVMEMLSSSGDEIACCTASIARFSPRPMPVPMIAAPPFCITVRTSAKSTFTMPVTVMREEIPCVAWSSTSSAFLSASWNGIPLPTTASSRSFGTTTMVSTCLRISAIPISAWRIRLRPSNRNGLVTMPIVSAPRSRAICEMMGAAPVPVPPPMPQVTNTRSAPCRPWSTSSRFSSIAWRPISGRAPAPSPRVSFLPICTFTSALLLSRACESVFTEMNSTPWSPSSTMRFRALPPPPPTPTTFIRAFCETVSSSSKIMAPSGDRSEEVLQPSLQRSEQLVDAPTLHEHASPPPSSTSGVHAPVRQSTRRVQHQPDRHGVAWRLHAVHEPRDPLLRGPGPYGHREHFTRELDHARQMRGPARQHHACRQPAAAVPRALELALRQLKDLVHSLVDDVRQQLARRLARPLTRRGRQIDHLRRVHQRLVRHPVALLQSLRVGLRHAQPGDEVARHVRPGELERRQMPDLPFVEDRHAGRSATHLDQRDAQLFLVVRQYGERRGERLEHQLDGAIARALHALAQVLRGRRLHRDEVHLDFESRPGHAYGVRDPALLVDHVLLRDVVQELLIPSERDGARDFVHPRHVLRGDLVPRHRHDPRRGAGSHVLARDPAGHAAHLDAGHPLRVAHGAHDGAAGLVDVPHHPAPQARVLRQPHAQNLRQGRARQVADDLRDHGARLGAAEIEPGHELAVPAHAPPSPPLLAVSLRRTTTCPA